MESRFIVQIDETSRDSVSTNASASTANSTKIARGKNRKYFLASEHESFPEAKKVVIDEKIWTALTPKNSTDYYRCNSAPSKATQQCSAALYIYKHSDSNKASIFRTICPHDHFEKVLSVTKPTREYISKSSMTLGDLASFCIDHNQIPGEDSPHEPFVLDYQIFDADIAESLVDYEEGDQFRVVITTRYLLTFSKNFKLVLQTDGTYKLVWQGYSIIILGSSDFDRHFHGILISICSREAQ